MRLGDLDALLDEICSLTLTISGVRNGKSVIREILVKYRDAILHEIADAPTIDAVEVVRCKDCKVPHNRWTGCPELNGLNPPPDFFCAYGERKDGD